jgi:Amt family ammonium transporter
VLEPGGRAAADAALDYASVGSDFFFQLMFCAATASIVSGALAERIKLWPFLIFVVVLTGFIYPISGSWQWGGGWLTEAGLLRLRRLDRRALGRWLGRSGRRHRAWRTRIGKYGKDGKVNPMPGSNLPLATLGTFILWLGWFGFNGGSQLAMGTVGDVSDVSPHLRQHQHGRRSRWRGRADPDAGPRQEADLTMVLNGALAGLVSITAEPLAPTLFGAL